MGTPIRRLLHPKILSPLSPTLRPTPTITARYGSGSPLDTKFKAKSVAKSLNFHVSSLVKGSSPFPSKGLNTSTIKVEVTDYSAGLLLVNTPNKNNLLENGLYPTKDLRILGKGSFGVVVPGIYKGAKVAVKIAKLSKNAADGALREKNALNLKHKNVVKIIDTIINRDANYGIILMEHLQASRHLQSILDDQSVHLNLQIVAKYALDICNGLKHCHENQILHLDLKPTNVLVCENSLCKLCDFGNSVKLSDTGQLHAYQGTAAYAAPELLLGKPPSPKCDVYSLGILLWQMRYREIPYSDLDGVEVIIYKVVKFGHRPSSRLDAIQDDYFSIYSSCWAANPIDRPDISSIINMLSSVLNVCVSF